MCSHYRGVLRCPAGVGPLKICRRMTPCMYDIQFFITTGKPQQNRKEDTFKACVYAVHLQGAWGGSQSGGGVCACVGELGVGVGRW